ncbi:alpha/beta hydrolase [Candidatus Aquiluna sp. UB-MaderosW2red]|uniref:alpha/beta hydrolase n=1 Tax=Candidatus Aquiluna sp. UB-MaderosW2red TaxID=1855377 RepID=UPI000875E5B4|nr:prolyl oligopeptidase family serine peptidase [Candidatus Aquiluna sp. UB-MaderosW2red]SCX03857.1 Prolyl oligopeptidase family protein [Candidatus Aquiluna sp. UB-MaderosW2red]
MRKSIKIAAISAGALVVALTAGGLAIGDYVYTSGTAVPCGINTDDLDNSPEAFYTSTYNSGPYPSSSWNQWVGYDLSEWWLTGVPYDTVEIPVAQDVTLEAWWITPLETNNKTVIVTHGIGTSRRDFNALLPAAMLVKSGFNVLLVDMRDTGGSTCTDGRHSAGQEESSDFAEVALWLKNQKGVPARSIGMFGVSGGAIMTSLLPAKTEDVSAFAMEGTIFDFSKAATAEVEFQGFPGFLWQFAEVSANLFHGVDLGETSTKTGIEKAGNRPMLILHGDQDERLDYQSSVDFYNYAKSVGANIELERFVDANHTEGMLTETDRYAELLTVFFDRNLG